MELEFIKDYLSNAILGFVIVFNAVFFLSKDWIKNNKIKKDLLKNKQEHEIKSKNSEKIAVQIANLKHKKVKDQKRVSQEFSDMIFSDLYDAWMVDLQCKEGSKLSLALMYNIAKFKVKSKDLVNVVIYHNAIAEKSEEQWATYINKKILWLYKETQEFAKQIFKEDFFNMKYEELAGKTDDSTKDIYFKHIYGLFSDLRLIALSISIEIKGLENSKKEIY